MKKTTKGRAGTAAVEAGEPLHYGLGRILLFVHLALSPLIFSASTVEVFEYNKVAILITTAIALVGGWAALAVSRWIRDEPPPEPLLDRAKAVLHEPVALGMVLFFISCLCSTFAPGSLGSISVRTSIYGAHESFAGIFTMAGYLALFFGTRALCKDARAARILLFATVVGVGFSGIYGVMQLTGLDPIKWGRTSGYGGITRVFATMGHPNFYSAFLLMGFPVVAYYALRAFRQGLWLIGGALVAAAVLDAGMVLISISRGAWVGFGAMFAVLVLGWAIFAGEKRVALWTVVAGIFALLATVLALSTFPDGQQVLTSVAARFQNMTDTNALTRESRGHIWGSAIQMFREHPVFGIGLDGFQLAFEHFRTVAYWNSEWNGTPTKAHNEFLHILAMQGLAGLFAMILLTLGTFYASWRALRRAEVRDKHLVVVALAGMVGFYVQDFFSFTVAGCGTLFITYAAIVSRLGEPASAAEKPGAVERPSSGAPAEATAIALGAQLAIAVASILAVNAMVWVPFQANSSCRLGASYLSIDPRMAVDYLRESVRLDPSKELYWVRLGTANQIAARSAADAGARRSYLEEARKAYQTSIELVPANSYNWANLGRLLGEMAKEVPAMTMPGPAGETSVPVTPARAYDAFEKALELDPNNAYFYADAGNAALSFGDQARCEKYATTCVELYPNFAPPISQLGYIKLMRASLPGEPTATAKLLEEAAALLLRAYNADWHNDDNGKAICGSNLAAALIKCGRPAEAKTIALDAVRMMPDYTDARFNLGKALEMLGDFNGAHAEYLQVLQQNPNHGMAREALRTLRQRMQQMGMPLPPLPPKVGDLLK